MCVTYGTAIKLCVFAAPRYSGDTGSVGPTGPGYGETERRGSSKEIRVRRGLLLGHTVVVAAHQTKDVVSFRRTLLVQCCQGESDSNIRILDRNLNIRHTIRF